MARSGRALAVAVFAFVVLTAPADAARRADLTIARIANPVLTAAPGDPLVVGAKVRNGGRRKSPKAKVGFLLSNDARASRGDILLGVVKQPKLKAGKLRQLAQATFPIPLTTPFGPYLVIACADHAKKLKEARERNNCRASKTRVAITQRTLPGPGNPPAELPQDDPEPPQQTPPAENPAPVDDPTPAPAPIPLNVVRAGNGSGSVASDVAGITCGDDCSESYAPGTVVTLTAAPAESSVFAGWSGGGCSGTGTCVVTVSEATAVAATFTLKRHALNVVRAGNGAGTVTGDPAGISCGADCSESYDHGTSIQLTAEPAQGTDFTGWSGACSGTDACTVSATEARQVTATFTLKQYALTTPRSGNGAGTITSTPEGIDCGGDCSQAYDHGTTVTLTAAPAASSNFTGWSGGGCSGTGSCTVTMTQATEVTATFTLKQHMLTVSRASNGTGTVVSTPAGINCGADCTQSYDHGTSVTLTAMPSSSSTFAGWSGGGCSGTGSCTVTMTQATAVVANFTLRQYVLTVNRASTGGSSGTVTSSPAGINCGVDCSEAYNHGTIVFLTATPSANSQFAGWSGGGCSGAGSCAVNMAQTTTVTANFVPVQHQLSVGNSGAGSGTVVSNPAGINCGADCTQDYNHNTTVSLQATPAAGSTFTGWSGGGCSGTGLCVVSMTQARQVTATFSIQQFTLTVTKDGSGSGTIVSSPVGVSCGDDCSEAYDIGTRVRLVADAGGGSFFSSWNDTCDVDANDRQACTIVMDANKVVTATFIRPF